MQYYKYRFTFKHEVWEDEQLIKKDIPMLYYYTSIRPLEQSELQEMFSNVIAEIIEKVVEKQ